MLATKISRYVVGVLVILTPATSFAGPLLGSSVLISLTDGGDIAGRSGIAGTSFFEITDVEPGSARTLVTTTFAASTISLGFSIPLGSRTFLPPASLEVSGINGDIVGASATGGGGATSFTAHSVTLDLSNQFLSDGQSVVIDLDFASAAPEPSALTMFGSALVGLALLGVGAGRRNQI